MRAETKIATNPLPHNKPGALTQRAEARGVTAGRMGTVARTQGPGTLTQSVKGRGLKRSGEGQGRQRKRGHRGWGAAQWDWAHRWGNAVGATESEGENKPFMFGQKRGWLWRHETETRPLAFGARAYGLGHEKPRKTCLALGAREAAETARAASNGSCQRERHVTFT